MSKSKKGAPHDSDVLRGMARGPWALHWANEQEEEGRSFSGGTDLYEAAPEAPQWAVKWARRLADAIVDLNHLTLTEIYVSARNAGFTKNAETFGYYLGMQAEGHGVHWTDDGADDIEIQVPSMEFYEGAKPDLRFVKT